MDLILRRLEYEEDGIFSQLETIKAEKVAVTLEHAFTDGAGGFYPKLPPGVYTCKRGMHTLKNMLTPFETFEITGVPGHTGMLFHVGNFNADSDGCVCLGREIGQSNKGQMVTSSKPAFFDFMELQSGVLEFKLDVRA